MKLYRITATNRPEGELYECYWVGSQTDAAKKRKELVSSGFKRAEIETVEVDVPTDKKGLLAWLNAHWSEA